ncbi:Major Facilitator Superfamily protein [Plantibacter sp. VKM Ac-1784]|uniref:Major Facilitator Superfamily protein n=1 Tax=Plantibacter elymi (nom. nud.) TaxID=199708 RepID=A0ABY1REC7_9MICO|nr:Major Facilitator Superfamily protein [Plantibacter sp. VKM Ac-1784]
MLTTVTLLTVTVEILPSGLLPVMSADLGVSESAIGLLVSAWALTIAIVGIPLVRLTIRVPRTPLLAACLIVIAAANLLTATASGLALALAGRIVAATAHGLFWALVVSSVASVITAERLGRALAIVLAGPTLAGLAGLPAAAALASVVGWRAVFTGLSVVLVLTAGVLWLILPQVPSALPTRGGAWDRSASRVIAVAIAGGLVLVGHFAVFTYLTALVTRLGGLPSAAIPLMLLVFGMSGAVGIAGSGADNANADETALAEGCASGTTNYPSQPQFNCLSVTLDGSGEKVVLRQGQSGASGFGYLHALLDHNVEQQTIEHTVSINTGGYAQPNGRYLYGAYYKNEDGDVVINFELIQERGPGGDSPDPYELGVVTAYCRDSASAPTRACPQWVNDSL